MSYVVLDTDVASLIFRDRLPPSIKDFADFADNNGLILIGDDRSS